MQALVHFTVGVFGALVVLTFVDRPAREEFLWLFFSGFWGMVPDGYWLLLEFGIEGPATAWRSFHGTPLANVFWFHHLIDSLETGRQNLEAGVALAVLLVFVLLYYWFNDWTVR